MGWFPYSTFSGFHIGAFHNDKLVKYIFVENDWAFIVKEMTPKEKQISKKAYKFIKFNIVETKKNNKLDPTIDEFSSNQELFKLVIDNGAMNPEYKRHFAINKIIQ